MGRISKSCWLSEGFGPDRGKQALNELSVMLRDHTGAEDLVEVVEGRQTLYELVFVSLCVNPQHFW